MAASTDVMNGTDVILQISEDGGTTYDTIGKLTSCSLSVSLDTRDTTSKESSGWAEKLAATRSWSMSGEGLVTYNAETDVDKPNDLFTLLSNRTKIKAKFGSTTTDEFDYEGDCFITAYEQEAGVEENVTYSITLDGTGSLTQATV